MGSIIALRSLVRRMGLFFMYYVYHIQSIKYPQHLYIGYTADFKNRLRKHNEGGSVHTASYRPWRLVMYHAFQDEANAIAFEKYLKSGSGNAFAKKRFW